MCRRPAPILSAGLAASLLNDKEAPQLCRVLFRARNNFRYSDSVIIPRRFKDLRKSAENRYPHDFHTRNNFWTGPANVSMTPSPPADADSE